MNYIELVNERYQTCLVTDLVQNDIGGSFVTFYFDVQNIKKLNNQPIEIIFTEDIDLESRISKYHFQFQVE